MKKSPLFLIFAYLLLISVNGVIVRAEEMSSRMTIELAFPKKSTAKMTAPKPKTEPVEVSGLVKIDVEPKPNTIETGRYSIEYFLDEELLYQSASANEENPAFSYTFDTKAHANGYHKLIVNFWDALGPSAIGIREIIINNPTGEQ